MMTTLVLPDVLANELVNLAIQRIETGAVLIATVVKHGSNVRLLANELHMVPKGAYVRRTPYEMEANSDAFVPALGHAEEIGGIAIWVHNHPGEGAVPLPSQRDDVVDSKLAETFRIRTSSPYYGALIVSPVAGEGGLSFSGALDHEKTGRSPIDRIWIVGDRIRLIRHFEAIESMPHQQFDRNVRAFGGSIQSALGELTVGIVGCGGTGSSVAEQLARLGVRRFVLLDPDRLSLSNTTRVYGSVPSQVGKQKVDVAASNIMAINSSATCIALNARITEPHAVELLAQCDVVFGCTDDNAGRLVLSRFSTYLLCPLIDCGVLISSEQGLITGIDGRITVQTPGTACLICRSRIDLVRAGAELMSEAEQKDLAREGYAPALGQVEPSVITFTTTVAAAAVNELLERLVGFGPASRPSEILLRFHDREISTNTALPRSGHYCHQAAGKWAIGLRQPYLDLAWRH